MNKFIPDIPKALLFGVIFIVSTNLFSQENATFSGAQQEGLFSDKVGPSFQSPTAAAFNNYVSHPEVGNDGKIDINVPIYTITDQDINLPIQLSYSSGGIKVNSKATWVGTGWKLMAGGIITRTVKDLPDDAKFLQTPVNVLKNPIKSPPTYGWLHTEKRVDKYKISNFPPVTVPENDVNYTAQVGRSLAPIRGDSNQVFDLEPDLYHFYANGQSFDFVFNEQGEPKILGLSDYKIEYTMTDYPDLNYNPQQNPHFNPNGSYLGIDYKHYLTSFTVTDPRGFKYFFEYKDTEKTKVTYKKFNLKEGPILQIVELNETQPEHITAWHLSKIESPTGAYLLFSYQDELIVDMPRISVYRGFCEDGPGKCPTDANRNKFQMLDDDPTKERRSKYEVKSKTLSRISNNNIVVNFIQGAARRDSNGGKVLSSIEVKSGADYDTPVLQYNFDYFYQSADDCYPTIEDGKWCNRLYLNKIDQVKGTKSIPQYQFEYNSTKLPYRFSYQQDAWGYYNANNAKSLIPQLYVYPTKKGLQRYRIYPANATGWTLFGANRQTNSSALKAGALEKITFPTGGSRKYYFEANKYYDPEMNKDYLGGGLRIGRIVHDAGKGATITKRYSYDTVLGGEDISSGTLFANPVFGTETNFFRKPGENLFTNLSFTLFRNDTGEDDPYVKNEFDKWNVYTKRSTEPYNQIEDKRGNSVLYTKVTEEITGNGKTIHYFNDPETYATHPTKVKEGYYHISTYGNLVINRPAVPEPCYFYNDHPDQPGLGTMHPGNLQRKNNFVQPYPPMSRTETSLQYQRGMKSATIHYDNTGRKVSEQRFKYTIFRDNDELVYGLVYKDLEAVCRSFLPNMNMFGWARYHYVTNAGAQLSEVTTKTYDTKNKTTFLENIEKRFYEAHPKYSVLTKKEVTDSKGNRYTTQTYYPFHLSVSTLSHMNTLVTKHRIAEPIRQVIKKEGKPIQIQQKKYDNFGGLILPKINQQSKGDINDLYDVSIIDRRDAKGNVVQFRQKDGHSSTIIWGYKNQYPIAKIENATYDQISVILINAIKTKSDQDNDRTMGYTGKEGALRKELDALRQALPKAMITTYTYDPLIGITSETDTKGYTMYYQYDEFNRLTHIRDSEQNIIEKMYYNYADINSAVSYSPLSPKIVSFPQYANTTGSHNFAGRVEGGSGNNTYKWELETGDGKIVTVNKLGFYYTFTRAQAGNITVRFIATDTETGKKKTVSRKLTVYDTDLQFPATVKVNTNTNFTAHIKGGSGNYSYKWTIYGGGATYTSTKKSFNLVMGYDYYGVDKWVNCDIKDNVTGRVFKLSEKITVNGAKLGQSWTKTFSHVNSGYHNERFRVSGTQGSGHYSYYWTSSDGRTSRGTEFSVYMDKCRELQEIRCTVTDKKTGLKHKYSKDFYFFPSRCNGIGIGGGGVGDPVPEAGGGDNRLESLDPNYNKQ